MANQPSPVSAQPPPDLPAMSDVSDRLSDYLRRFSLWCRHGFQAKIDMNVAQVGLPMMGYDAPAGAAPNVYQFEVSNAGVAGLAPVPMAGTPGAFTPITTGFLPLSGGVITGPITPSGGVVGVTNGSNAAAGQVGEYQTATLAFGSALAMTSTTPRNIVTLPLTAGDWDVSGMADFTSTGSPTGVTLLGSISSVSATLGAAAASPLTPAAVGYITMPTVRFSSASPMTAYLVSQANFTGGTISGWGQISARRAR